MKSRAMLAALVLCGVFAASPSQADYTLRWWERFVFPVAREAYVSPFPIVFSGDLDGDGDIELVGLHDDLTSQTVEVRSAMTGMLEGSFNVAAVTSFPVSALSIWNVDNIDPPEIVVTLCTDRIVGIAVYGWAAPASALTSIVPTKESLVASPNPLTARSSLMFTLGEQGTVEIEIFDVAGRLVRRLVSGSLKPGTHASEWDGCDDNGRRVEAGNYFYSLKVNERIVESRKAVVLQ